MVHPPRIVVVFCDGSVFLLGQWSEILTEAVNISKGVQGPVILVIHAVIPENGRSDNAHLD